MRYLSFIIFLVMALSVKSQNPVTVQQEKMSGMLTLAGTWTGSGWIILPDGKKHSFNQTETVTNKMDGGVLAIDGNGKDLETGKPIHTAFAILTYDNGKQSYRWTAISSGYVTDVVPDIEKDKFIWKLNTGKYIIRYTINFSNNEWVEKGEQSADDGKSWTPNFEMHLKKS